MARRKQTEARRYWHYYSTAALLLKVGLLLARGLPEKTRKKKKMQ
jgi:hypothetical protein